jgi:hypothetical protein
MREDAMTLPNERQFERRLLHTGESSTTCVRCHTSAGSAFWEFELDELESRHVCGREAGNAASALPPPRKPARQELVEDPATPRRHARRLGRASRLANL